MTKAYWGFVLAAAAACAQTPAAKPEFEVASIRMAEPLDKMVASGKMHIGVHIDGARVDIGSMALPDLIQIAYKVKRYQLSGAGADGIGAQRFDIQAKLPEGATKEQVPEMLQALLEERFKLKIHRDSKDQPVYALVVGKGGPKMKESPPEEAPQPDDPKAPPAGQPGVKFQMDGQGRGAVVTGSALGTTKVGMGANGTMHFEMQKMSMPTLAEFLARFVERPVIDMTDLKGNYQVGIDLSMEEMRGVARSAGVAIPPGAGPGGGPGGGLGGGNAPADAASEPSGSIFSSIQQLGLKLESRKAPIEIIVVDHVEKMPTEN